MYYTSIKVEQNDLESDVSLIGAEFEKGFAVQVNGNDVTLYPVQISAEETMQIMRLMVKNLESMEILESKGELEDGN